MIIQLIDDNGTAYWAKTIDFLKLKMDIVDLGNRLDEFVADLYKEFKIDEKPKEMD